MVVGVLLERPWPGRKHFAAVVAVGFVGSWQPLSFVVGRRRY